MACFTLRMILKEAVPPLINAGFNSVDNETAFLNKKFNTMKKLFKRKIHLEKNGIKYTSSDLDALFNCWGLK